MLLVEGDPAWTSLRAPAWLEFVDRHLLVTAEPRSTGAGRSVRPVPALDLRGLADARVIAAPVRRRRGGLWNFAWLAGLGAAIGGASAWWWTAQFDLDALVRDSASLRGVILGVFAGSLGAGLIGDALGRRFGSAYVDGQVALRWRDGSTALVAVDLDELIRLRIAADPTLVGQQSAGQGATVAAETQAFPLKTRVRSKANGRPRPPDIDWRGRRLPPNSNAR